MKRIAYISAIVAVVLLAAIVIVRAETREQTGWHGHRWGHFGPAGIVIHELDLSDAQRAQIKTLWQAERPTAAAHLKELLQEEKEMNHLSNSDSPDPAQVQQIADREGATIAALLLQKDKFFSTIYKTVLTPNQRTKADALRGKMEQHLQGAVNHLAEAPAGH